MHKFSVSILSVEAEFQASQRYLKGWAIFTPTRGEVAHESGVKMDQKRGEDGSLKMVFSRFWPN